MILPYDLMASQRDLIIELVSALEGVLDDADCGNDPDGHGEWLNPTAGQVRAAQAAISKAKEMLK